MPPPKARRVDYSPDEYIAGVGGVLDAAEQGVYWMICTLIMSEGRAIERNDRRLASLCLRRPAEIRKLVDGLVAKGKIGLDDAGRLTQKRAQSEVELSLKRIQIASENGGKGGRPRGKGKQNQQKGKPDGYFPEKLSPTTNDHRGKEEAKASSKKRGSRIPDDWSAGPELISWAVAKGLSEAEARDEADRHLEYWRNETGQRASKLDWDRAFQTWVKRSLGDRQKRQAKSNGRDSNGDLTNAFLFSRG